MTTLTDPKRITPETDRSGKRPRTEYKAEYDGMLIGSYPTYLAAETALNAYVLELAIEGLSYSAKELDEAL